MFVENSRRRRACRKNRGYTRVSKKPRQLSAVAGELNTTRRVVRAAASPQRRPATRSTLVRVLRRLPPEYLNNIRYLLRGQKVTEKPPR